MTTSTATAQQLTTDHKEKKMIVVQLNDYEYRAEVKNGYLFLLREYDFPNPRSRAFGARYLIGEWRIRRKEIRGDYPNYEYVQVGSDQFVGWNDDVAMRAFKKAAEAIGTI